jgi:putative addiction module CopG family antidote
MTPKMMNISLPDPLNAYVEARVAEGEFGTPGEYIRALIQQDWDQRREGLETALLDALKSRRIAIAPEEVKRGNLVAVLREKLT